MKRRYAYPSVEKPWQPEIVVLCQNVPPYRSARHLALRPKRDVLAINLLVVAEHEGVRGVEVTRGGAPPDEENHLAFFAHVGHWS